MSKLLWVGFVTGSDREHDVGGVEAPSTSPNFGGHHAQIRIVGRCFYIKKPDRDRAPVVMASDPPNINQSAPKPAPVHQRRCSLTLVRSPAISGSTGSASCGRPGTS